MTVYAVIRKSDSALVYAYHADAPIYTTYPPAEYDHIERAPVADPPAPPAPPRLITKFAFRQRFTQAEKITIELASLDVPSGSMEARAAAAQMRVWLSDVEVAQFIDLNYQPTRDGVQALEDYGLIGVGRAAEVLDTPPTEDEVWNG